MDKYKQGSGVSRKRWQAQQPGGKPAPDGVEAVPAEDNALSAGLDAVLQRQLDDKLKNSSSPPRTRSLDFGESAAESTGESGRDGAGEATGEAVVGGDEDAVTILGPSADSPSGVQVMDEATVPVAAPAEAAPVEAVSEAAPVEAVSEAASEAAPAEAVPVEVVSEAAPVEAVSEVPVDSPAVLKEETVAVSEAGDGAGEPLSEAPVAASEALPDTAPVEGAAPSVQLAEPSSALADWKAGMAGLADRFSDLARNQAEASQALIAAVETGAAEAVAAPLPEEGSALAAASPAAGSGPSPVEPGEPAPIPRKDAFVAAAEKERVLKMIRDAATRRMEEGFDLRSLRPGGGAAAETPEPVTVAETPVSIPAAETPESAPAAEPEHPVSQFAIREDTVSVTPAPPVAEAVVAPAADVTPAAAAVATGKPVEPVLAPGTLVPPVQRVPLSQSRHKQESLPTAARTRINEAYLRQLKGTAPLDDEPSPAAARTEKKAARAAPARPAARRQVGEDGLVEVPVESLGTGIFNALGDMVGGVVHSAQAITRKGTAVVSGVEAEELDDEPGKVKPTGTDRAAQTMA
ncbi:MAG: hypothetical protein HQL57_11020, partial [Magnetococcales bacterium]|nr:hypothetical protein [Magnetococcales bacterium]